MDRRKFVLSIGIGSLYGCTGIRAIGKNIDSNPINNLDDRIGRLVEWIRRSYTADGINLLSNLPSGRTHGGNDREDLRNLYWLQNCNLFGMYALMPYDAVLAEKIRKSYFHWYSTLFPEVLEKTEHYLAIGQLPGHQPPEGRYFRAKVLRKEFDGYIIGTESYDPDVTGKIMDTDPRSLLKFGAMGCWLRGEKERAHNYLQKALSLWDGKGFGNTRIGKHGAYYTRHISYAFIAERMLQTRIPDSVRIPMEHKLWACQDSDGGIWTNYMPDGSFPHFAKKTNESGPLALLAYSKL